MWSRRSRWRGWIAAWVIAGLALTALGPLPWLMTGLGGDSHIVAHASHEHAHGAAGHVHQHRDASDVPGSPTHPPDHDCLACQVLAHLGRCCALPAPPSVLPASIASFPAIPTRVPVVVPAFRFALKPPARAPPPYPA